MLRTVDPHWWTTDRALTLPTVRRLIAEQFPDLAGRGVSLLGMGWDSEVFEVEGGWLFRFPKRADVLAPVERERRMLPLLARALPLAIPHFERLGEPSTHFPYPFAGYRKLPGIPLQRLEQPLSRSGLERVAQQYADFLRALHAFEPPPGHDVPLETDLRHLSDPVEDTTSRLSDLGDLFAELASDVQDLLAALKTPPPPPARPVFSHADLDVEHLLIDPESETLSGVIDWSDMARVPAITDFTWTYGFGGRAFAADVLQRYGDDELTTSDALDWLRLRQLRTGVHNVAYGRLANQPDYVRDGLRAVREALR
jgi:aminoglycoside phosphotransferase (APT) family kinase protein